ncbi:MAG: T9SS C-terminal target domain-containing protein [Ignavibacteriae bacterium]|nr:MAG: T9SS C-terminal target domain-containing protein [Ignavibacteriota bacterium]
MKKTIYLLTFIFYVLLVSQQIQAQSTWQATSLTNAPVARNGHTVVWTGSKMIVWGGQNYPTIFKSGAMIDTTNTWTLIDSLTAPEARRYHTAVWTGSKMIVWGGSASTYLNTGGVYDLASNSWTATTTTNAPAARFGHSAVWVGNKMVIWGGYSNGNYVNTGGIYDAVNNTWTATSLTNAPCPREHYSVIWTGSKLLIWGGNIGNGLCFKSGGIFDPVSNTWTSMDSTNAPTKRFFHTAIWTGSKMIVWGGAYNYSEASLKSGGTYDPVSNTWTLMDSVNAPSARNFHSAVWTGNKMVIWGGWFSPSATFFKTGGIYDPASNTWIPTDTVNAPTARADHKAVWTGNKMLIWGGFNPNVQTSFNTGGIYQSPVMTSIQKINNVVSEYSLLQNYPNPFNPSTIINYKLSNTGHVKLSIFNILGKEVEVLINEKQNSGSYEILWNASGLPSGIYFYRITVLSENSGSYIETKKMILAK